MTLPVELAVRPMHDGERAWVIDSWKRSYCKSWDALSYPTTETGGTDYDMFMSDYTPVILALLESTPVQVVHLQADADAAIAWACSGDGVLHYTYVKRLWRKYGVCRWFMGQLGLLNRSIEYTHRTRQCERTYVRGARIEPDIKIPKEWQYRKFKAWRKAS